ncbi:MAG: MotA/TolQ/ExbB proton channel family protein [Gammaproteobacteria bacterium]|nr:MotA/TolQ/ExbB proton channel family protein [Gammaproteobacteria bacterium]MDE2345675.1 MotA/TolQ/ExbB proton channel family protein [Gammaproteobacteria bacterium]
MSWQYVGMLVADSYGVLYVMAALLLIALAVIIDRGWQLRQTILKGGAFVQELSNTPQLDRKHLAALVEHAGNLPEAALVDTAYRHHGLTDVEQLGTRLDESIQLIAPELDRRLWILDTIVTLAPLLGLFGTILGMFKAFHVLAAPGHAPTAVTGGVADALVATASGLFIAMVGLLAFNAYNNQVRLILHQLDSVRTMLLNRLDGAPLVPEGDSSLPDPVQKIDLRKTASYRLEN